MTHKELKVCFVLFCLTVLMWSLGMLLLAFDFSTFYSGLLIVFSVCGMYDIADYVCIKTKIYRL